MLVSTHPYATAAYISRSQQAALAAAKVLWPDTDAVNRHAPQDDVLFRKYERAILLPVRGAVPFFNEQDVRDSYGPNQVKAADRLASDFLGLYWLVARRRLELERPPEIAENDGPDWSVLAQAYVERLHWISILSRTGATMLTAMRVLEYLQRRGGPRGIDDMALDQVSRGMEPDISFSGSHYRVERVGPVRVGGHPRPDVRDYQILGRSVPQIGRRPAPRSQILQEI